eukprot:scaffold238452_cov20-Prasinocladus_malaysianus.AAC.1
MMNEGQMLLWMPGREKSHIHPYAAVVALADNLDNSKFYFARGSFITAPSSTRTSTVTVCHESHADQQSDTASIPYERHRTRTGSTYY